MNLSDKGRSLLEQREGCVLHVYNDVKGLPTIGYGHLIKHNETFSTITQQEADNLFKTDIQIFVDNLNTKLGVVKVTQDQFDAMVSLSYNIGEAAFNNSTVLRDVLAGKISDAAKAFQLWNKPPAIIGRRFNEYKQFKGLL